MPYFYDCKTQEEAKAKYKKLAKELHPDKGGSEQAFKAMQAEYERLEPNSFENTTIHGETYKKYYGGFSYRPNSDEKVNQQFYSGGFGYGYKAQFDEMKKQYDINVQLQEYAKEIQRLTETNLAQGTTIYLLKCELDDLKTRYNNALLERNAMLEQNFRIENHWLIGRLAQWFGLI